MSRDIWKVRSPGTMTRFTYSCPKTYHCMLLCFLSLTVNPLVNELYLIMSHFICILKFPTPVLPKDACQCEPVEKTKTPQYCMHYQNPCNFSSSASALRNHPLFHVHLACGKRGQHLGTRFLTPERH